MESPKLRTVEHVEMPYPLGKFPDGFVHKIVGEIVASLACGREDLEGKDWEKIFAKGIGAKWKPSNVGLDDILVPWFSAAWGAKTIKHNNPFAAEKIRLISGRNSPAFSYDVSNIKDISPRELGEMVVEIWNERVAALYRKYKFLRTVVLIKGPGLRKISIFEKDTVRYNADEYNWQWNKNGNLTGSNKSNSEASFTWQPHGSQFTIHETVPEYSLKIEIKRPDKITTKNILEQVGFDSSFYKVLGG